MFTKRLFPLLRPMRQSITTRLMCDVPAVEEQAPRLKSVPVLTGERGVNKVTLVGRVGRDPELRGSEENPVTIFSLATSQSYRTPDGAYHQNTDWHRIVVFRRILGQVVANTIKRGDKVYVSGSVSYSKLPPKDGGVPVTLAQIKADDVINLSGKTGKVQGDMEYD